MVAEKEKTVTDDYGKAIDLDAEAAMDSDFAEFLDAVRNFDAKEVQACKGN